MANFVGEKTPEVGYASRMSSSEKQRVVVLSIFASLGLTITKFAAGLATGSLGILSEAIHSLIDLGRHHRHLVCGALERPAAR